MKAPITLALSLVIEGNENLCLKDEALVGTLILDAACIEAFYTAVANNGEKVGACIITHSGETFTVLQSVEQLNKAIHAAMSRISMFEIVKEG